MPRRNMKSHDRKVRKARGKFNPELAARLKQLTPTYRLDHLVSPCPRQRLAGGPLMHAHVSQRL